MSHQNRSGRVGIVTVVMLVLVPLLLLAVRLPQQSPQAAKLSGAPIEVISQLIDGGGSNDPDGGAARHTDWFWRQRAYPLTTVPANYSAAALAAIGDMPLLQQAGWTSLGPAPIRDAAIGTDNSNQAADGLLRSTAAGRVKEIVITPNGATIFVATANGGIWRSTDGGQNWTSLTASLPYFSFHSLTMDPANPQTLYAGTGELAGYYGSGILKTTDGGQTWSAPLGVDNTTFGNLIISSIKIDPTTPTTVYASTSRQLQAEVSTNNFPNSQSQPAPGIFRSTDSGQSWTRIRNCNNPCGNGFSDLVLDESNPQTLYAAEAGIGVWKTVDSGQNWTAQNLPALQERRAARIELAIGTGQAGAQTLYAGVEGIKGNQSAGIIYATSDGGTTWVERDQAPNYCSSQCFYDNVLRVDPRNPQTVVIGGSLTADPGWRGVIYRSTNAGITWTDMTPGTGNGQMVHPDMHALAFDPTNPAVIWAGHDGGLSRYSGTAWESRNGNMNTALVVGLAVSAAGDRAFIGMQDNAHAFYQEGQGWTGIVTGDGGNAAYDAVTATTIYATYQNDANTGLSFTAFESDGADPVARLRATASNTRNEGIPGNEPKAFYVPLISDPRQGGVAYVGTNRIWRTANSGTTWVAISQPLTDNLVNQIAVAPSDSSVVYAGATDGRVWVGRLQAGGQWQWAELTKAPLPNRYVAGIAVSPGDVNNVYLAFNGFSSNTPDTPGHVFRSTDGGQTWTRIDGAGTGALPDVPAISLIVVKDRLYVGTDIGVFSSNDNGQNWSNFNQNSLAPVPVTQLRYNQQSDTLWAGTYGRGVLRTSLAAAPPPPAPTATSAPPPATATVPPTATPPAQGPVPGTWRGERATFGITNNQLQVYNLRIRVEAPGVCSNWFTAAGRATIGSDRSFSITVAERSGRWTATGTIAADGRSASGTAVFDRVSTGSSVCGNSFSGTINWTATWVEGAPDPVEPTATTVPPTATPAATLNGINGRITAAGRNVAGLNLTLRQCSADANVACDADTAPKVGEVKTDGGGFYNFTNVPTLPAGQVYFVYYLNDESGGNVTSESYLWRWFGPDITSYTSGTALAGGSFDIADILLLDPVVPANQATVRITFPTTFTWKIRVAGERYAWQLFDLDNGNTICRSDPNEAASFVLTEAFFIQNCQPAGVRPGGEYGWFVWALSGTTWDNPGSFGDTYYVSSVTLPGKSLFLPLVFRPGATTTQAAPQSLPAESPRPGSRR